ncbi:hypothetical protein [Calothrix sp. NIES-2098]|uniref:hypothetical protein n=1 Tax=Calothrix sp. NIES-2098 TaxID=1954171 RepID=UPI000B5F69A3|nr:hypothetical protein NIES2098_43770 [Calothrix sp. NIES-2098]
MERIIKLNAVENSSQGSSYRMKFDEFMSQNHLAPEKVLICGSAVAVTTVTVLQELSIKVIDNLFSVLQRKTRIAVLE